MAHSFNSAEWEERKKAKEDLSKPHAPLNSVKGLGDRLKKIQILLGIKPSA